MQPNNNLPFIADLPPSPARNQPSKDSKWKLLSIVLFFLISILIGVSLAITTHKNKNLEKKLQGVTDSVTSITKDVAELAGLKDPQPSTPESKPSTSPTISTESKEGTPGPRGATGSNGSTGPTGPAGPSGVASCPNGPCLSLQAGSPGTQETGNINISGIAIASSFTGNGANLSNVNAASLQGENLTYFTNASNMSSGTLADARLSTNVALLNGTGPQTFTGNNSFTGTVLARNAVNSTAAFQVQDALGTSNLFIADTTNSRIGVGTVPSYLLDVRQSGDGILAQFSTAADAGEAIRIGIDTIGKVGYIAPNLGGLYSYGFTDSTFNPQLTVKVNDNKVYFGNPLDTNLYRSGADTLKTDDTLHVGGVSLNLSNGGFFAARTGSAVGNAVFVNRLTADTQDRFQLYYAGQLLWGDGINPQDTNLYRSAANVLKTDDSLNIATKLGIGGDNTASYSLWNQGTDASRFASNVIIDSRLEVNGGEGIVLTPATAGTAFRSSIAGDANTRLNISHSGLFGWGDGINPQDTNLYRDGASVLRTDGRFRAASFQSTSPTSDLFYTDSSDVATRLLINSRAAGDANARFVARVNGELLWGDGINPQDTNLYRSAAGILKTDGYLHVNNALAIKGAAGELQVLDQSLASNVWLQVKLAGDTQRRLGIDAGGTITWGAGGASLVDTNLYRRGANQLATDDAFYLQQATNTYVTIGVDPASSVSPTTFGGLYFDASNNLRLEALSGGVAWRHVVLQGQGTGNVGIGDTSPSTKLALGGTGSSNGITLGDDAVDAVNLYRSAANTLKTDDTLIALGISGLQTGIYADTGGLDTNIMLDGRITGEANARFRSSYGGKLEWGAGGLSAVDTNLYRSAANILKTDDYFVIEGGIDVNAAGGFGLTLASNAGTSASGIRFGSAQDTNLYRSAAGQLATDSTFRIRSNSTAAFQIQNSAGTTDYLTVNAGGSAITLGTASATPILLVLGNKNSVGDPACTNGAIYYNSNSNQFRGCANAIWTSMGDNKPTVRAYHNVNQNVTLNTITVMALNSERFDTDVIHDTVTNNSRLTAKTAGKYNIFGNVLWATAQASGNRVLFIRINGVTNIAADARPMNGENGGHQISTTYELAVNDYVELVLYHNGTGVDTSITAAGNYSPEFGMTKVAD